MMIVLFLSAGVLCVLTVMNLRVGSTMVKIGYSDLAGYEDGKWYYMFVFAALGGVLGVMHNLITVRIYEKKGASAAMLFLAMSLGIAIGAIMYLAKLLGEG